MKHDGLLLINLGTPENPDESSVRKYLRQFLADRRVINLPAPLRYLLLYGFILPFRPRQSAKAYQAIWTKEGSPLLLHSQTLKRKLQQRLQGHCEVALAMRYGNPSIKAAVAELERCRNWIVLPLYPQYSSAATGSSIESVLKILSPKDILPNVTIIRDFHQHPSFIKAQANVIAPYITEHDYLLFSYHGIPENHILQGACKRVCKISCSVNSSNYAGCYRAQCLRTSDALAKQLNLASEHFTTSFQSRLGKTPWIKPYTDDMLEKLAAKGIKKLAVACPSFVADCLETLEEIGIRAQAQWKALGGETLTLIPSLNSSDEWVEAVVDICRDSASR